MSSAMRWLYVLVLVDLAGAGAGAGQAVYTAYDLGRYSTVVDCLRTSGVGLLDANPLPGDALAGQVADFQRCAGSYNHGQGVAMLAGAAALPVLAVVLMLFGGALAYRRSRPARRTTVDSAAVRAVATRFVYWCDAAGLHGRRRPELVVAKPGRHTLRASTTALPGRRYRVVVPVGYAYVPQEELDLILLHELAHVRMRDVTWASATWWTGWLNVPALLAAFGPLIVSPLAGGPALWNDRVVAAVGLAALLSLVTLLLRAAVLRRRERLADRYAVLRGGCLAALRAATGSAHTSRPLLGKLFAGHLRGTARAEAASCQDAGPARHAELGVAASAGPFAAAGSGTDAAWETGAAVAAAAGLLWMFCMQAFQVVLTDLTGLDDVDGRLVPSLALTVAAAGWAATLIPLWARAPGATWARAGGAAAGLLAGFYLQPPGTLVPVGATLAGGHLLAAVLWTAPALAGAAVCAALLAAAVWQLRGARRVAGAAAAALGAAAALYTATDTVWSLLRLHWQYDSIAVDRHMLNGFGGYWWAAWTPAVLLAATAVLAATARQPLHRDAPTVLAGAVAASTVAIVATQLRIGDVDAAAEVLHLLTDRWWMCALAGWAVTVVTFLRRRSLPAALLAGAGTAMLAGLLQFGRDVLVGSAGHNLRNAAGFLRLPVWLMCCAVLLTLPIAAAITRPAPGTGRRAFRRPAADAPLELPLTDRHQSGWRGLRRSSVAAPLGPSPTGHDSSGPDSFGPDSFGPDSFGHGAFGRRRFGWTFSAGLLAASAALLVAGGWLAPLTGREADLAAFQAKRAFDGSAPPAGGREGRQLSAGEAEDVLSRVMAGLPAQWTRVPNADGGPDTGVTPESCAQRQATDRAAEAARSATADVKVTESLPQSAMQLIIEVASYPAESAGAGPIEEAAADLRECPEWTSDFATSDDHRLRVSAMPGGTLPLPYPGYLVRTTVTFTAHGRPGCAGMLSGAVHVGHNVVTATLTFPATAPITPPVWLQTEAAVGNALGAALAGLGN